MSDFISNFTTLVHTFAGGIVGNIDSVLAFEDP